VWIRKHSKTKAKGKEQSNMTGPFFLEKSKAYLDFMIEFLLPQAQLSKSRRQIHRNYPQILIEVPMNRTILL
jgi:hypothetical protein